MRDKPLLDKLKHLHRRKLKTITGHDCPGRERIGHHFRFVPLFSKVLGDSGVEWRTLLGPVWTSFVNALSVQNERQTPIRVNSIYWVAKYIGVAIQGLCIKLVA